MKLHIDENMFELELIDTLWNVNLAKTLIYFSPSWN